MKWVALFCSLHLLLLKSHTEFDPNDLYTEIAVTDTDLTHPLLQQRFTYIGRGAQMLAFASEDGAYVLKIFKGKHKARKLSRMLTQYQNREGAKTEWRSKFADTCRRYELAFEHLKAETGLVLLHFHKTKSALPVTLIDKTAYRLDLSAVPFILQKKAILVPQYIRNNPTKKAEATQALKDFFVTRIEKGFSDPRQSLNINYGFIDDKPIQIDVGKIERFEGDVEAELQKIHSRIDRWASSL